MEIYHAQERVSLTLEGRTIDAVVLLASNNGQSLALGFEAFFAGYLGLMPVLFKEDKGEFVDLVEGRILKIERKKEVLKNLPFADAQTMREKHPETFEAPTFEELNELKPGHHVKVCIDDERFWIQVTSIDGSTITGRIDNDLVITKACKYNDLVEIHRNNIYSILKLKN